jgi:SAM-dependent methyltransferase
VTETDWLTETRTSYDTVASSYAETLRDALDEQPVVLHLLGLFADLVHETGEGPVADVGCGPGRLTEHLRGLGLDAFGIDLSPGMIAQARREYPGIRFEVGSMTDLELADASVTGVLPAGCFSIFSVYWNQTAFCSSASTRAPERGSRPRATAATR